MKTICRPGVFRGGVYYFAPSHIVWIPKHRDGVTILYTLPDQLASLIFIQLLGFMDSIVLCTQFHSDGIVHTHPISTAPLFFCRPLGYRTHPNNFILDNF